MNWLRSSISAFKEEDQAGSISLAAIFSKFGPETIVIENEGTLHVSLVDLDVRQRPCSFGPLFWETLALKRVWLVNYSSIGSMLPLSADGVSNNWLLSRHKFHSSTTSPLVVLMDVGTLLKVL
jgi:hypothetical protein